MVELSLISTLLPPSVSVQEQWIFQFNNRHALHPHTLPRHSSFEITVSLSNGGALGRYDAFCDAGATLGDQGTLKLYTVMHTQKRDTHSHRTPQFKSMDNLRFCSATENEEKS